MSPSLHLFFNSASLEDGQWIPGLVVQRGLVSSQRLATLLFASRIDSGISEGTDPEEGSRELEVK